jgi:hypothetical protein
MWTQIVGKIRMVQSPWQNHSWHVSLHVTPRGLTTGNIPHGQRWFSINFDFLDHFLVIRTCEDQRRTVALAPRDAFPEALFYSYAYPGPDGFAQAAVQPAAAYWHEQLGEFVLPLSAVVATENPDATLLSFLQSSFDAAAATGKWDLQTNARRHFP